MILYSEGDTAFQEDEAHQVLGVLCAAYPGHPWAVLVRGGVIFIRHLELGNGWGMNVKFSAVQHDAAVFKREIIRGAGEWLERAGLVRGRSTDDPIIRVEGVPEKYQPVTPRIAEAKQAAELVVADEWTPLRTEPRPQVLTGVSNG